MNRPEDAAAQLRANDLATEPTQPRDVLDRFCDACERVMPDLPQLGAIVLFLVIYLVATGSSFGPTEEVLGAMNDAAAAAEEAGITPAF